MKGSDGDRSLVLSSFAGLACILVFFALAISTLPAAPVAHAAISSAVAAPRFPGPLTGTPTVTRPTAAGFAYTCNVQPDTDPAKVAGTTLAPGTAIRDIGGCGQALLYLNAPASGHFQASFAVADTATSSSSILRLFLVASGGYLLRSLDVQATKGSPAHVDFDVSGGITIALTFPTTADSFVYDFKLTGTARALKATPLVGSGLPVGGSPVPAGAVQLSCNASAATEQSAVSDVVITSTDSLWMTGCGKVTVQIPAPAKGALALRFGESDNSTYSSLPTQVGLRVLDAAGHLLRKSIGLTYLGSGLQPIWVNLQGGSTATFTLDGGNQGGVYLSVVGLSFLPTAVTPHHNPDREVFGSPSGGSIPIAPDAVVDFCNAGLGTSDASVDHRPVLRDNYIAVTGCGLAELIVTNASGSFSAKIGVSDSSNASSITAHLVVLDQNSKPLTTKTATATLGRPATTISAGITGASIVQITFTGNANGIIYDMRLTGHATLYDRVFPPSEPPVATPGGVAIDPRTLTVSCNVELATQDFPLIHEVALEQWSIYFNGCGNATMDIASLHGSHGTFSAMYGIALQDQKILIAHPQFTVLDAKGKTLRQASFVARSGYGPQRAAISLAGGAKLQITSADGHQFVLFALTAA